MLITGYGSDVSVHDLSGCEPFSGNMCKQWFNEKLIEMKASLETTNGYHEAVWSDTRTQKAVKLIYERGSVLDPQTYFAFIYLVFISHNLRL